MVVQNSIFRRTASYPGLELVASVCSSSFSTPPFIPVSRRPVASASRSTSLAILFKKPAAYFQSAYQTSLSSASRTHPKTARTYRLRKPAITPPLKPRQMPPRHRSAHHNTRIRSNLVQRQSLLTTNRIILRINTKTRNPDPQQRIHRRGIPIISPHSRIPKRARLHHSVKLVDVFRAAHGVGVDVRVLRQSGGVLVEELLEVAAEGARVDLGAQPGPLQGEVGRLQVPGVGADDGGGEEAGGAFFGAILWVVEEKVSGAGRVGATRTMEGGKGIQR